MKDFQFHTLNLRWLERAVILALFVLIIVQVVGAARYMSLTIDETAHLPAGYSYWRTGDYRLGRENPPLVKLIASFPLLFLNPKLPTGHPAWREFEQFGFGKEFLFHANQNADVMLFWGRMSIAVLSLALAFFVYKWARELYGRAAGLFALFLYALEPNILAHSSLVTLDLGLTLFMFLAVYCFWRFLKEPSTKRLLIAGITFGLALAAKFTAVLLVPIYLILALVVHFKDREISDRRRVSFFSFSFLLSTFVFLLAGFVVIFATYKFRVSTLISPIEPVGKHTLTFMANLSQEKPGYLLYSLAKNVPLPAGEWFRGFISQMLHAKDGHNAYLMGAYSNAGWWYYYPVAFAIKTSIPLLILIFLSFFFYQKKEEHPLDGYFIIIPTLAILLGSMLNRIDIGIRYILPLYPFLIVQASRLFSLKRRWILNALIVLLSFWYFLAAASIYPHYLAYFNEFVGGPNNGQKYLADSNLDWGQDLKGLKQYLVKKGIKVIKLSYFGTAEPSYYALDCRSISESEMHKYTPGTYAVSVNNLLNIFSKDKGRFSWLRKYKPKDKIGYSIFIYDIR